MNSAHRDKLPDDKIGKPDLGPFVSAEPLPEPTPLRAAIEQAGHRAEHEVVAESLDVARLSVAEQTWIETRARDLIAAVRQNRVGRGGVDAFLREYHLSSAEGVVLMCVAEALLRIPDAKTRSRLIRDKIAPADWQRHLGRSSSLFVNASTWALLLTGRLVGSDEDATSEGAFDRVMRRSSEPVIRRAMVGAMRILGRQFVLGGTIETALKRAETAATRGYRHSFDMLGEAARTAAAATRYEGLYRHAIQRIAETAGGADAVGAPSISVKLSALHPRYEWAQRRRVMSELLPRLRQLAIMAKAGGIGFTIDAEEADRLDLSLDLIDALSGDPDLAGWDGFGLAVQAYGTRALAVTDFVTDMARRHRRRLMVRLVKGAYWDQEIKFAQERGYDTYPVFTRKAATDVNYIACVKRLLAAETAIYPMFATHNALTVAAILELAGDRRDFEFQRLHGMGEALYDQIVGRAMLGLPCRVYAPVGGQEDLLAYLVRRLLENGANSSFIHRLTDERVPAETILADPIAKTAGYQHWPNSRTPLPRALRPSWQNSRGFDLADPGTVRQLRASLGAVQQPFRAAPMGTEATVGAAVLAVSDPSDRRRQIGFVIEASREVAGSAVAVARVAQPDWDRLGGAARAAILERAAELIEGAPAGLAARIVREGGRTLVDALDEIREAVDFCRYYAAEARRLFGEPATMPGPTGETNQYMLSGRGVFACISPWNFPLAIFLGQAVAALAAGNAVVAKPAEQTPLVAGEAVRLLHQAGVPPEVLHLLPGDGRIGAVLVGDPGIAGIAFTGSTETARTINRMLASRDGPIVLLIAETGGINALIADSSALPEQLVADVVRSAFNSAGQRCSALRILLLQREMADTVMAMLAGALAKLKLGDPALLETDIGPVIDEAARDMLEAHLAGMTVSSRIAARLDLPESCRHGTYVAPAIVEIGAIADLDREIFGPILHVVRYDSDRLDDVIQALNETGYGLTLGIHSRIDQTIERIARQVRVGNLYVNRNMVGAVVGVQPFGGEGLSGTGPKAGGPLYLARFAVERARSINTTAAGGNAALLALDEETG